MNTSRNNEALSADDLKSQLYQSLHSSGLLKQLKGQLRQSMINELKGKGAKRLQLNIQSKKSDLFAATIKQHKSRSWIREAIDNLVYLHLKQNGYHYALSLFEQESCVETYSQSLLEDLLQRLGLNLSDLDITVDTPASSLSEEFSHLTSTPTPAAIDPGLGLWKILEKLSLLAASKSFAQVGQVKFVEDDRPKSLGEKLKEVDQEMQAKELKPARDPAIAISSYTAAVRKAEEDAERRATARFEQWKSAELVQFKIDESKKSQDYVETRIRNLENDYQLKREALQNREKAAISRLQQQREMLERDMHEQRQSLLREIEQIRMREEALHKQEEVIHEMELLKRDEIKLLQDRMELAEGKYDVKEKADTQSQNKFTTEAVLKKLQQQLQFKCDEMEKLKEEISHLKKELTCSRRYNQSQADRENLILRSHLDLLTREIRESKTISKEDILTNREERLRQEIIKLKGERSDQEAQQRHLKQTLNDMKLALEDSNAALTHLNQNRDNQAGSQQKDRPSVANVASSYTPPTKRVSIREYEPVQTSLHPALVSSGEFDDPSMDEHVASANVRLDLLQRVKELEEQTYEVDEHYQRYIKTHYRNLEMELNKQTKRLQPFSKHWSPTRTGGSVQSGRASQAGRLENLQQSLLSSSAPRFSHLTKNTETLRLAESESSVRFQEPVKDDSVTSSSCNVPLHEISEPSKHPISRHTDTLRSAKEKDFSMNEMDPNLADRTATDDLKLFVDNLERNGDEEVLTSSSKASSEPSRSPEINTARRVDVDETSQFQEEPLHPRSLPPIAVPRKLPSLTPLETESSPSLKESESPSKESPRKRSRLSSEEKPGYSIEKSGRVNFQAPEFAPLSTDAPLQPDRDFSYQQTDRNELADSNVALKPEEIPALDESSRPTRPQDIQLNRVRQVRDGSEATQSPSAVSEMSLPSFSSSTDNNPLLNLKPASVEVEEPSSSKETESISGRVNPVAKSGQRRKLSDQLSEEEDSEAKKMTDAKAPPKKNWDDFDLTNDEDISEALRFSDAVKPTLDFDDEEELNYVAKQVPAKDVKNRFEKHEEDGPKMTVDVFEMSDNPLSLDSADDGKEDRQDGKSDVSW